jgi:PAS domain S-box-containing protein
VNKAALRLLGYRECELVDKEVTGIFERGTYDSRLFRETRLEELERSGFFADIGAVFVTKNGARVPVSVSESLLRNRKGRPIGVVLFARDLSERRKLETEVMRAQKLDSLSKLARGVAHDFNNILTAVLGNVSLARSKVDRSSELQGMLRSAEKAALLAKGLSRQLLTFTRGGDPIKEPVSIGKLVRDTVEFTLRGAEVRCDCRVPDDLHWADVDREQMSQVLANIVINAKQAMLKGGTLSVRCRNVTLAADQVPNVLPGPAIEIAVQDTGTGIPRENIDKVFDPFFTTKSQGSGLGLAVSQSVVRKHGGLIVCESIEGVGSTFRIFLPAVDKAGIPEDTGTFRVDRASARVLVMDDDELVRLTFESVLAELGYSLETAVEGGEALDKYAQAKEAGRPFDVVIMDLVIPGGMGGKDAIARLRERDPDVIAVVTSGYCDDPVMANYREYGFAGVLPKPFKIDEVAAVLEQVLSLRKPK